MADSDLRGFRLTRRGRARLDLPPVPVKDEVVLWVEWWNGEVRAGGMMIARGDVPITWRSARDAC